MQIKNHVLMTAAIMMLLAGVSGAAAAGDEQASLSQITFHVA